MRFRFLIPIRFIGAIRRKVRKKTISSSRRESLLSVQKYERASSVPGIEIEPPQVERIANPEPVVSNSSHLERSVEFQDTIHSGKFPDFLELH